MAIREYAHENDRECAAFSQAIAIQSPRYDDAFWKELLGKKGAKGKRGEKEIKDELGV